MAISDRIDSIITHIENAYDEVSSKGGTLPQNKNLENLANAIYSIQGGSVDAEFDFSSDTFTDVNIPLFANQIAIRKVTTTFPSTLSTISTKFINANTQGYYKSIFNSIPSVAASRLQSNVMGLTNLYYFDYSNINVFDRSGWSSFASQTVLSTTNIASGTTLQKYIASNGYELTWYSDDDTFANVVTQSAGPSYTYYARTDGLRKVYYISDVQLLNANIDIVDTNNNHYWTNGNRFIPVGATITITVSNSDPNKDRLLTFKVNGVDKVGTSATITISSNLTILVIYSDSNVNPILEYNDWATIRSVCEAGQASNYWSVGDTKTDIGVDSRGDSITRTFRILDMQGLYGKHVVFGQTEAEKAYSTSIETFQWTHTDYTPVDDDGCYNNYSISLIRTTHLPTIMNRYSSSLINNLTDTTYKVAKNGKYQSATILDITDKLFIPAMKELYGTGGYIDEVNALTQYQYYVSDIDNSRKIKQTWTRSCTPNTGNNVFTIAYSGSYNSNSHVITYYYLAPCFAF